jgi:hypothetical protein
MSDDSPPPMQNKAGALFGAPAITNLAIYL